jgi:hypothetical protein
MVEDMVKTKSNPIRSIYIHTPTHDSNGCVGFFLFPESYSALEGKVNEQHVPKGTAVISMI